MKILISLGLIKKLDYLIEKKLLFLELSMT
nr:MAG TPA: hypothetical protein [Caudoviricetes sp.]